MTQSPSIHQLEPPGRFTPPRSTKTRDEVRVAAALMQRPLTPPKSILQNATAERVRKLLEKAPLFRVLDEQGRHDLATHAQSRTFAASQSIFRVGEPGHCMMGVVVGIVRISLPTRKGRDLILADLPAGEFFGEIALLDGEPRSASATALTNCELLVLDRRDMLAFLERSPTACLKSHATPLRPDSPLRRAHGRNRFLRSTGAPRQGAIALPGARTWPAEAVALAARIG